jgi:HNH endonuclease
VDRELEQLVRSRARGRCEYCHFPEQFAEAPFQLDHIVARKHGGATIAENLALACFHCNSYKGTDLAGIDPHGGRMVRLFNPRTDRWVRHFRLRNDRIVGLTAVGRATVHVLWLNHPLAVEARRWIRELS